MDSSGDHVAARAPAIPEQQVPEGNEMYWAQLSRGRAINPGTDRVASFDNEPAPGSGINIEQDQTVNKNSLEPQRLMLISPAQAALELQLADLGNGSGFAQTQTPGWLSPASDSDVSMGESSRSVVSGLLSPSLSDLIATYGDLPSEHEESDSDEDLDSTGESSRSVVTGLLSPSLSDLAAAYGDLPSEHEESSSSSDEDLELSDD